MTTRVIVYVCSNGLGHLRRVTGVLAELIELRPDVRVTLVCQAWQVERARAWRTTRKLLDGCDVVDGIMEPGVAWSNDPKVYADGRLEAWIERAGTVPELTSAALVVTDNLASVLEHRSDAVLMGSFLWSDVLDAAYGDHPAVQRFVARERAALTDHRPVAVCVGPLAMPGLRERADLVEVGWMCAGGRAPASDRAAPPDPGTAVAVLGGATGAADELLTAVADRLRAAGLTVVQPGAAPLSLEELAACAVAVVRPGAGTITDCLAVSVPMVLVHEPGNAELEHNGQVVARLGLGEYVGPVADAGAVIAAVARVRAPSAVASAWRAMAAQPRDGLREAAQWLASRLDDRTAITPAKESV